MIDVFDTTMLGLAISIGSERSRCTRLRVGCVLVDKTQAVMVVGANVPQFTYVGCSGAEGRCGCVHAEEIAFRSLATGRGRLFAPHTAYVSHSPCEACAKELARVGVERVVYDNEYRKTDGLVWLRDRGVTVERGPVAA